MNLLKFRLLAKILILALILVTGFSNTVFAETGKISGIIKGIVLDISGNPLPGVTIQVVGTTTGTATDLDGEYSINVSDGNKKLHFTYIGFLDQNVTIGNQTVINVVMREASQILDDVVIVGYGKQKKESVTASISTVNMATVNTIATPQVSGALGGTIPGIITRQAGGLPGLDPAEVYIRGISTFGQNRQPLILIDGVERDLNAINIQEIESISTLKDASATAVYGVRGANGVIMVKTKSGKKGKAQVTLRTEWAQLRGVRFPKFINAYEYASLMNEGQRNVGIDPNNLRWNEEELQKFKDHSDPYLYPDVNWIDEVFKKNAMQTINNLSVSGGNEDVRYFVNVGYTLQGGLMKSDPQYEYNTSSDLNRFNFRSNIDINLSKRLVIDLGIGGIMSESYYSGTSPWDIYNGGKAIAPLAYPVRNPDGSFGAGSSTQAANPYAIATQSGYGVDVANTLQVSFGARWDLDGLLKVKGFSVAGRLSYDYFYTRGTVRKKNFLGKSYSRDPITGEDVYTVMQAETPMGFYHHDSGNRAYNWEVSLNYDRVFNDHHVSGMALFNRRDFVITTVNEADPAAASIANLPYRRQGLAGRLAYDYKKKYLFEFNVGYNGSENFPKGERYGFFPSVSAGWVLSNEDFWRIDFVNNLKIRGSYGQVGNDQIGADRFLYVTSIGKSPGAYRYGSTQSYAVDGFKENKIGLQDVTWEVANKADIGLDIDMFNSRLIFQADIYYEKRDNILLKRQTIPALAGFEGSTIPWGNLGVVKNKGFDAQIEYKNHTKDFSYSIQANVSYAKNEIVENDEPDPARPYLSRKGHSVDQPFGLEAIGLFQDQADIDASPKQQFSSVVRPGDIKYKDQDGDGFITSYDEVPIGHTRIPELMFGFGGFLSYKGIIDVSVNFTGATRTSTFIAYMNPADKINSGQGIWTFSRGFGVDNVYREYYDNRFIPGADNSNAKYPAATNDANENNFRTSTFYQRDASYIRLKSAEIGFNVPKKWTDFARINKVRVFVNGMNLLCFDKLKFIDPEVNYGTGGYPQQRTINLGAQINF